MAPRHVDFVWDFSRCFRCNALSALRYRANCFALRRPFTKPLPPTSRFYSFEAQSSTDPMGIRDRLRRWRAEQLEQAESQSSSPTPITPSNAAAPTSPILPEEEQEDDEFDESMQDDDASTFDNLDFLLNDGNPTSNYTKDALQLLMSRRSQDSTIRPGALMHLHKPSARLVIFLGFTKTMQQIMLHMNGQLSLHDKAYFDFCTDGFLSESELAPILLLLPDAVAPKVNEDYTSIFWPEIPKHIVHPLVNRMLDFQNRSAQLQRTMAPVLMDAHNYLAHPTKALYLSVDKICNAILDRANPDVDPNDPCARFAITRQILADDSAFLTMSEFTQRASIGIVVLPTQFVTSVNYVTESIDAHKEVSSLTAAGFRIPARFSRKAARLQRFTDKCHQIMHDLPPRIRMTPHWSPLPIPPDQLSAASESKEANTMIQHRFTEEDRHFIRILLLAAGERSFLNKLKMRTVSLDLIRAMNIPEIYGDKVTQGTFLNLLIRIGVINHYTEALLSHMGIWPLSDQMQDQLMKAPLQLAAGQSLEQVAGCRDSMQHLRKDWGDTIAYALDAQRTNTRDDSFSIEPVPGSPDHYWIHSHIAHISAFASPNSLLGRSAAHSPLVAYFRGTRVPMFPEWAASAFGLDQNKHVLTFSAKIGPDGDILDVNVQPGIIRNLFRSYPSWVDLRALDHAKKLAPNEDLNELTFQVGSQDAIDRLQRSDVTADHTHFRDVHRRDLKLMAKVARSLLRHTPITDWAKINSGVFVDGSPDLASYTMQNRPLLGPEPVFNDPKVKFVVPQYVDEPTQLDKLSPTENIIQKFSIVSAIVAAKWAGRRKIPLYYSGSGRWAGGDEGNAESLKELLENDSISGTEDVVNRYLSNLRTRRNSSSPIPHHYMNLDSGLAGISTPLRSYSDMLNHWQIDAALQEEAKTGKVFNGEQSSSVLPFQKADVDEYIGVTNSLKVATMRAIRLEKRMWILQLIARGFYFNEFELPAPLFCVIRKISARVCLGRLIQFDVTGVCHLRHLKDFDKNSFQHDEIWEVKLELVDPFCEKRLSWTPVKRVRTADGVWLPGYQEYFKKKQTTGDLIKRIRPSSGDSSPFGFQSVYNQDTTT